jgi:hypothetical protein
MSCMSEDFKELCLEIVQDNVVGQKFNDLLIKTGVCLDEEEWSVANRLLLESEEMGHLAVSSMASVH